MTSIYRPQTGEEVPIGAVVLDMHRDEGRVIAHDRWTVTIEYGPADAPLGRLRVNVWEITRKGTS